MGISAKVKSRVTTQIKRYQGILSDAHQRDVNEANTVVIIRDMLTDVLGYDKYHNVTGEYPIKGTKVDLSIVVNNKIRFLVEAKAIGIELKDNHVKQIVDYAANEGIDWVVLTNGILWRVYTIQFNKPIDKTLVCEVDVIKSNCKGDDVVECFGNLSLERFSKDTMADLFEQQQIMSKFVVASALMSEGIVKALRRELHTLSGVLIDCDYLTKLLKDEIIKRDLIDADEAKSAQSLLKHLHQKSQAQKSQDRDQNQPKTRADVGLEPEKAPDLRNTAVPQAPETAPKHES
jgi:hypothetical protein